ncbi:MAG TPA: hypothetical protein VL001_11555 [Candidimonas sp.]|nr:hypothetical protein [Candidimonas sp.]
MFALRRLLVCLVAFPAAAVWVGANASERATAPALRDLAPIQVYAAPQIGPVTPEPLPEIPPSDGAAENPSLLDAVAPEDGPLPDVSYDVFWDRKDFGEWRQRGSTIAAPGLRGTRGWRRTPPLRTSWLRTPSRDPWTLGASNWRYSAEQGLDVTLGNDEIDVPSWGNAARLGGVSISQSSMATSSGPETWQYALSVGALDNTAGQPQGDLDYGPTASNAVLRYGLSPEVTLESQLELAPELMTSGVGGRYSSRRWGAWSAGVARATHGLREGWRYQAAYEIDVLDDLRLSWVNEKHTGGFADLSRYQEAATAAAGIRQQWLATVDLGRWGDLSGMYENYRSSLGDVRRSFGLTQQFWYSPNLRIGLRAERESVSGDYDVGLRFSVPIN